jgi:hypothetical protein
MENDADCMTMSRPDAADPVPEIDAIHATVTLHRAIVNCEHNAISLSKRHHYWPRLHTRPLLGHHEFAAREVFVGFRQQNGELERENMLAIEVLVQAVVIVGAVLEQKRCRSSLTGLVASPDEVCMFIWIANINTHRLVPSIGDRNKMRIDSLPEARNEAGQRIAEIFVFAAPETMACHYNMTAEDIVVWIEAGYGSAFVWNKKAVNHRTTLCIEVLRNFLPSDQPDSFRNALETRDGRCDLGWCVHLLAFRLQWMLFQHRFPSRLHLNVFAQMFTDVPPKDFRCEHKDSSATYS